jgi:hypothetical protein
MHLYEAGNIVVDNWSYVLGLASGMLVSVTILLLKFQEDSSSINLSSMEAPLNVVANSI